METLELEVQEDFLTTLIKKEKPEYAIEELIWNSLDADAKLIRIYGVQNALEGYDYLKIEDDGHGISYGQAKTAFQNLGGSSKKHKHKSSVLNRSYHGKEGKGRFQVFTLGSFVEFESCYKDENEGGIIKRFVINWDFEKIKYPTLGHEAKGQNVNMNHTGTYITIRNCYSQKINTILDEKSRHTLIQKFAYYYLTYPDFKIIIQKNELDFTTVIKNKISNAIKYKNKSENEIDIDFKIIEWDDKYGEALIHFCDAKGLSLAQYKLGVRTGEIPLSIYVSADYFKELETLGMFSLDEFHPDIQNLVERAKTFARDYIREKSAENAQDFITELKSEKVYPFPNEPNTAIEKMERQVFDIITYEINEAKPKLFSKKKEASDKRVVLELVKMALKENKQDELDRILTQVIGLSTEHIAKLDKIIKNSSLSDVIEMSDMVLSRLQIIDELNEIFFNEKISKGFLERSQLQKIIETNTWLFGENYAMGVKEQNLKNVLKQYLNYLGRDDFEGIIKADDNSNLEGEIPDICLFKQRSLGHIGEFSNLIIELKRPSLTIKEEQIAQIKGYARAVSGDKRFPKEKTEWTFYLMASKVHESVEEDRRQRDRPVGLIYETMNVKIWVFEWGDLLSEAAARHQYLKEKLNYQASEEIENLPYLHDNFSAIFEKPPKKK